MAPRGADRDAAIAFYHATGGPTWYKRTGWLGESARAPLRPTASRGFTEPPHPTLQGDTVRPSKRDHVNPFLREKLPEDQEAAAAAPNLHAGAKPFATATAALAVPASPEKSSPFATARPNNASAQQASPAKNPFATAPPAAAAAAAAAGAETERAASAAAASPEARKTVPMGSARAAGSSWPDNPFAPSKVGLKRPADLARAATEGGGASKNPFGSSSGESAKKNPFATAPRANASAPAIGLTRGDSKNPFGGTNGKLEQGDETTYAAAAVVGAKQNGSSAAVGEEGEWCGLTCESGGRVRDLQLTANNLKGELPASIGSLARLKWLVVSQNAITGPIPASIGSLSFLERLDLSQNQLTFLPKEIGELTRLITLQLSYNALQGPIPPELGRLKQLTHINLGKNRLSGGVPAELASIPGLTELLLDNNQLTGSVPEEFREAKSLKVLSLANNKMSGTVPSAVIAKLGVAHVTDNICHGNDLRLPLAVKASGCGCVIM